MCFRRGSHADIPASDWVFETPKWLHSLFVLSQVVDEIKLLCMDGEIMLREMRTLVSRPSKKILLPFHLPTIKHSSVSYWWLPCT
jgi:hypothetical protein